MINEFVNNYVLLKVWHKIRNQLKGEKNESRIVKTETCITKHQNLTYNFINAHVEWTNLAVQINSFT